MPPRDPIGLWKRLPEAIAVCLLVWATVATYLIPDEVVSRWVPW